MQARGRLLAITAIAVTWVACSGTTGADGGVSPDAGNDAGLADAGSPTDAGGTPDAGGNPDAGPPLDAGVDAGPPLDAGPPDAGYAAPHQGYPQVPNQGGPRLQNPSVITVTFDNDSRAPTLESFAQSIVASRWLATVGTEYGINPGTVTGVAHRPETPPAAITSGDIESYLAAGITDGSIPRPTNLGDALYIVYYPRATAITTTFVNGIIKHSCTDFVGYHGEAHQMGLDFSYAAIPDCNFALTPLTAIDTVEMVTSHEFLEAATDAFPITAPAYQVLPDPTDAWFSAFEFEVEVGDLCEEPPRYILESGFFAQRTWSNAAAAAGGEPCVPVTKPAFGTSATPNATQMVPAGGTVQYTLQGWSDAPVGDWQIGATPFSGFTPTFSLSQSTLNNGGTATLTVTVPADAGSGSTAGIILYSSHSASDTSTWALAVTVP